MFACKDFGNKLILKLKVFIPVRILHHNQSVSYVVISLYDFSRRWSLCLWIESTECCRCVQFESLGLFRQSWGNFQVVLFTSCLIFSFFVSKHGITAEGAVVLGKMLEMFILELSMRSWLQAEGRALNSLQVRIATSHCPCCPSHCCPIQQCYLWNNILSFSLFLFFILQIVDVHAALRKTELYDIFSLTPKPITIKAEVASAPSTSAASSGSCWKHLTRPALVMV